MNPLIYHGCAVHAIWCYDVTTGFNGTSAGPGWDYVTGNGFIKNVTAFLSQF